MLIIGVVLIAFPFGQSHSSAIYGAMLIVGAILVVGALAHMILQSRRQR